MKTFLINILVIVYIFSSLMILCLAIASPFTFGVKDVPPWWVYLILYFLTLVVMALQTQCFRYLDKLQNKNDIF